MGARTIRTAEAGDLDALVDLNLVVQELHVAAEPDRFSEPDRATVARWFEDVLAADAWTVLVAEVDGEVVGYLLFEQVDRTAGTFTRALRTLYVHQLGVAPAARRQGVGRALLQRVDEAARSLGVTQVALDTWAFNTDAMAFFERCGFEVFNVRLRRSLDPTP